jgi:hypothetical protein
LWSCHCLSIPKTVLDKRLLNLPLKKLRFLRCGRLSRREPLFQFCSDGVKFCKSRAFRFRVQNLPICHLQNEIPIRILGQVQVPGRKERFISASAPQSQSFPHTASIFLIISTAHWTDAAINLSVRGLPCGVPNRSSAVSMCKLARIAAMIPITRFRPSSIASR